MEFDNSEINKNEDYIQITREDIPEIFEIINNKVYLKNSRAVPFKINFPLKLNEELAKISAMILDGSISKNLVSCTFSQKKDKNKTVEFLNIIKRLFDIGGRFSIRNDTGTYIVEYTSKTFVSFLYYCLDIHKSDESARIPHWILDSPRSVIREYLRYAFAMEGSVSNYIKATEIKFHSVDFPYLSELRKLLKERFDINSRIYRYYIKNYGWKYNLFFADIKSIKKFANIGFALNSHQKRLTEMISYFKNKAWEITLVSILNLNKESFTITDINEVFPYLCRNSINHRVKELVKKDYVERKEQTCYLTNKGYKTAFSLKAKIKITELRTNPQKNEEKIIKILKYKGKSYRNEIARELKINGTTIRDTLKRLIKKNKIQVVGTDKFQRIFYEIKN